MSDDRTVFEEDLPAYVAGRLEPERARKIAAWLDEHPERAEFVRDWTRIARGLKEGRSVLGLACPDPEELIAWARGDHTDPSGAMPRHIETCASCSLEADAATRNRPRKTGVARTAVRPVVYRFVSLAAAAGLAVGIGLGVVLDPIDRPEAVGTGGVVNLLQLDPSLRSGSGVATYRLTKGQSVVPLVTIPELPRNAPASDIFRFDVLSAGGDEVWSKELTAAAIESYLAASGVIVLLVPTEVLGPGQYALVVTPASDLAAPPVLRVPFVLD